MKQSVMRCRVGYGLQQGGKSIPGLGLLESAPALPISEGAPGVGCGGELLEPAPLSPPAPPLGPVVTTTQSGSMPWHGSLAGSEHLPSGSSSMVGQAGTECRQSGS